MARLHWLALGALMALSSSALAYEPTGDMAQQNSNAVHITGGTISLPSTGAIGNYNSLFTNYGAAQVTLNDRVVIGAAASVGTGNIPASPQTWLDQIFASNMQNAQLGVLSTMGLNGIVGGSRTSDFHGVTNAIGVNGFGVNDDTTHSTSAAWGGYFAAQRNASSFEALGIESEVVNLGNLQVMYPPGSVFFPGGQTAAFWAGCGAGESTPNNCSAALAVVGNAKQFETGIIFQQFALDPARGHGGSGIAMDMYQGHDITWTNSSNVVAVDMFGDSTGGLHVLGGPIIQQIVAGSPTYGDNYRGSSSAGDINFTMGSNSGNYVYFNVTSNSNLEFFTNNTLAATVLNNGYFNVKGSYMQNGTIGVTKTCTVLPTVSGGIITSC